MISPRRSAARTPSKIGEPAKWRDIRLAEVGVAKVRVPSEASNGHREASVVVSAIGKTPHATNDSLTCCSVGSASEHAAIAY